MTPYSFKFHQKLFFYLRALVDKLRIFTDCSEGKLQLLIVEILWTLRPITHISPNSQFLIYKDYIVTKWGRFFVHPDLQSEISLTPSFERVDIEYLIQLVHKELKTKKHVLFIDIGAHIGVYTIALGNKLKRYSNHFKIIAFEPNANNFYSNNYTLLKKNIKVNNLSNVTVYNKGLGSKRTTHPNKFGITTVPLDDFISLKRISTYDVIFVKADIEGYETDAMKGASNLFKQGNKVIFLVEDSVSLDIITYLKKQKCRFLKRLTPYNSFWEKK